jgi:MFS family permease
MYTFGLAMMLTLFAVFAKDLGVAYFWIGVLFALFWVGRIVGFLVAGRMSDKYGRKPIATIAMIFAALAFIVITVSTHFDPLWEAVLVLGMGIGAAFPVAIALISDSASQTRRGFAMGIYEMSCAVGFMVASTIGGVLADVYSPRSPYILGAIVSLSSASILTFILHGSHRK